MRTDRNALFVVLTMTLALTACATVPAPQARMHSQEELNAVVRECGLALGELFQDESEKRLLFFFRISPSAEERSCVIRWAHKNHLRAVIVEAKNEPIS